MPVGGQIVEHPSKTEQIAAAGLVGQRRLAFAEVAEPGKQMRVAAKLRGAAYPRKRSVEPDEEATDSTAIVG